MDGPGLSASSGCGEKAGKLRRAELRGGLPDGQVLARPHRFCCGIAAATRLAVRAHAERCRLEKRRCPSLSAEKSKGLGKMGHSMCC